MIISNLKIHYIDFKATFLNKWKELCNYQPDHQIYKIKCILAECLGLRLSRKKEVKNQNKTYLQHFPECTTYYVAYTIKHSN